MVGTGVPRLGDGPASHAHGSGAPRAPLERRTDSFCFIFLVYRENTFTSATIEVAADQKVISTGPYAIVRHPMYASASLYLFGTPLALGSYWGLVPIAAMLPFLIWRLFDEERLLSESLSGYVEYQRKVPYRLLPGVW